MVNLSESKQQPIIHNEWVEVMNYQRELDEEKIKGERLAKEQKKV